MTKATVPTQGCSWIALLLMVSGVLPQAGASPSGVRQPSIGDLPQSEGAGAREALRADASRPDLMLAGVYEGDIDLASYWVSEKLDGVRAYWTGRRLLSRGGLPINAPAWLTRDFPSVPLDGELWMGRGRFDQVSGAVRRSKPDATDWSQVRYMVFDLPGMEAAFGRRLAVLRGLVASSGSAYLSAVEQFRVRDRSELMHRLALVERQGGEGLMLHRDDSFYRAGRSSALLKVKSYSDAEARVVGHIPGRGRLAGMLGSLLVEDDAGRRFRIGTGFTDAERRSPPPIGSIVTFKYQGRTGSGLPRFASFVRVREAE